MTEEPPSQEELELIGWGWQHVPGIVLGYVISGRKSLLEQIRKIRDEGRLNATDPQ